MGWCNAVPIVAMQDCTVSETGSRFIFEDESHLCESEEVDLNEDVCICFVLPEACVLDFY